MREIKFRAYSKSFNIMFDYDMLQMATAEMVDICNEKLKVKVPESTNIQMGLFLPTKDKDLVLMQYTGLKDYDNNEIYEGDIVKTSTGVIGIVRFGRYSATNINGISNIGFYIEWKLDICMRVDLGYWLERISVIGNIYENPELVEGRFSYED